MMLIDLPGGSQGGSSCPPKSRIESTSMVNGLPVLSNLVLPSTETRLRIYPLACSSLSSEMTQSIGWRVRGPTATTRPRSSCGG